MDPDAQENLKKIWSFIKSKKNDNTGISSLKVKNGITYLDSTMKVNSLNEQFVSVFNKNEDISTIPDTETFTHPTKEGVNKLLSNLQVH